MPYSFDQLREFFNPEKAAAMVKGAAAPFTDVTYPLTNPIAQGLDTAGESVNRAAQAGALNVLNEPTPKYIPEALHQPIDDLKTIGKEIAPPIIDAFKLTPGNMAGQVGSTLMGGMAGQAIAPLAMKAMKKLPGSVQDLLLSNVEKLPGVRRLFTDKSIKVPALKQGAQKVQISLESSPGQKTGYLPEEFNAPYAQRQEFHDEMEKVFYDANGDNILAKENGLPNPVRVKASGFYKGKMSPGTQEIFPPGTDVKKLKNYAAQKGLPTQQEAMGFDRPLVENNPKDLDLIELKTGKKPLDNEIESLYNLLSNDDFGIVAADDGLKVRNFSGYGDYPVPNEKFQTLAREAIGKSDLPRGEVRLFKHGGGLVEGGKNGRNYILEAGDIRGASRAERIFGQKAAEIHERFTKKYGWTNPYKNSGANESLKYLLEDTPLIPNVPAATGGSAALAFPTINKNLKSDKFPALRAGISRFR